LAHNVQLHLTEQSSRVCKNIKQQEQTNMKTTRWLTAVLAVTLCLGAVSAFGQDRGRGDRAPGQDDRRGGWDPAQMRERMMGYYREQLEIKDDAEWTVVQPLVQKVMDARVNQFSGMRGMFPGRGGPGGAGGPGGDRASNPETEALQKAVDGKASNSELKAALARYNDARKAKQAELEKAQDDLRKVLSVRQEALATMRGLL
jgi:hypothetical protein